MIARLRLYFGAGNLQLKLYILATLTGLLAGGSIVLFRLLIEQGQLALFASGEVGGFASMPWYWVIGLPAAGGLIIGLLFHNLEPRKRSTGVMHVIERLSYYEGRFPLSNYLRQIVGGSLALISGHSVGREGPSVHIGAANGSFIADKLDLPSHAMRILVASGAAAAIAASFDTPIAGVIFAMEVIMMEYHIATFIPIILASVSGAIVGQLVFHEPPFAGLIAGQMQSLWEIPYIIFLGIVIGLVAVGFIRSLSFFTDFIENRPAVIRATLAGVLVGLGGLILPDVMGMSYNLLDIENLTDLALGSLLLLLILKLVLSSACVGLGIPGGLIGPTLVIGALAGAILGQIGLFYSSESSAIGFYVLIGMAAMMGATLKAPLAALMALLELTSNTHIILPGMLAIVFSSIIVFELFKLDSVFLVLLRKKGLDYRNSPLSQALRQINVTAVMKNKFVELPNIIDRETAKQALADNPLWVVTEQKEQQKIILLAADLAAALNEEGKADIDLLAIPGTRKQVTKVSINHSLEGVISQFDKNEVSAAYVTHRISQVQEKIVGIITKENIEAEYQVTHN